MRRLFGSLLFFSTLSAVAQVGSGIGAVAGGVSSSGMRSQGPLQLVLEHKTVQTLADGTHLTNTRREYFYRDSQGRTRTENEPVSGTAGMPRIRIVTVRDGEAGVLYNWSVGQTNAQKEYSKTTFNVPYSTAMLQTLQSPPPPPAPPPSLVRIVPPPAGTPPTAAASQATAQPSDTVLRPQIKREELGTKDVQGFTCTLSRTTTTYPEGFFGNDRPITQVAERCNSRELGRVLESHVTDPRTGEQTTTVVSISRAEPDAALFQPPADYTEHKQNQR